MNQEVSDKKPHQRKLTGLFKYYKQAYLPAAAFLSFSLAIIAVWLRRVGCEPTSPICKNLLLEQYPNLIITRTYGMASLKVGYTIL